MTDTGHRWAHYRYQNPVTVLDEQGRRMFAFHPRTDPFHVLRAVAWCYARSDHPLCHGWPGAGCPTTEGLYCCECHLAGYEALRAAKSCHEATTR